MRKLICMMMLAVAATGYAQHENCDKQCKKHDDKQCQKHEGMQCEKYAGMQCEKHAGMHCANPYKRFTKDLPFQMPEVSAPKFPANTVCLKEFGAVGDGITLNTDAFARAIDALSAKGGGRLVVPAGVWFTGPITLKSNINLHLEMGAVIQFSGDDIFLQLLTDVGVVVLADFDNALDVAVYRFCKQIFYDHDDELSFIPVILNSPFSIINSQLIDEFEGAVIVVVFDLAEQNQLLPVVFAGIEHDHRDLV